MRCRAAGLTLAAPRPIPGFKPSSDAGHPDITVSTGITPPWVDGAFHRWHISGEADAGGIANLTVMRARGGFRFVYADGTRFWIDASGHHVWMTWETTFEDACTYLAGPVLAFVLRLRGALALHASAVQVGRHALALAGPHGAGKSTTAAALGRHGCPVITDDVLRLTRAGEGWLAHPDGGVLRLWPDAATLLFGDAGRLPRLTASWDKRALPLGQHGVTPADDPVPLAAIAFLDAGATGRDDGIVPLPAADALVRLIVNASATHLLDVSHRAAEFEHFASLAQSTRCAAVPVSQDSPDVDRFCDRLLAWARGAPQAVTI